MISLADEFEAPSLKAQLDILLLLSASLHPHLSNLRQSDRERWPRYLSKLAAHYQEEIRGTSKREHVLNIWSSFLTSVTVESAAPAVKGVLQAVGSELKAWLADGRDPEQYLEQANAQAHEFVMGFFKRERLEGLLPSKPTNVRIVWDGDVRRSCAVSSRLGGEIEWALQPRAHALLGALVARFILAHEYISHLAPRNHEPLRRTKEGWLLEVLRLEMNLPLDNHLLLWFRRDLANALGESSLDPYNPRSARDVAVRLYYQARDSYWLLTSALLRMETGMKRGDRAERALEELADLSTLGVGLDSLLTHLASEIREFS